jgi:hypothetical protein
MNTQLNFLKRKSLFLILWILNSFGIFAQGFATFEPIIPSRPQPIPFFYSLPEMDYEAENNKILVNYILQLQSQILDIKLSSTDKGFNNILDKYYSRLESYKSNSYLYLYEDELSNIPINLKKELVEYINENQSISDSKESNNEFQMGFVSPYYITSEWDSNKQSYVNKSKSDLFSKIYITDKEIYFKKGNDDWLVNKWRFDNFDEENNLVTYIDFDNQMVCFDKDLTKLLYFYGWDGEKYTKITYYGDLQFNENIVRPH